MKMGIELVLLTVKIHFESFLNHYLYLEVEGEGILYIYEKRKVLLSYIYSLRLVVNKPKQLHLANV